MGLKLVAGYFQFGSDYLGEGEMAGQFTSGGLNGHSPYTVQMKSVSGATVLNLQSLMAPESVPPSQQTT